MEKMIDTENRDIDNLVSLMKSKGYTREAAEIICTICNSEQAYNSGYTFEQSLQLAVEYVNKYDSGVEAKTVPPEKIAGLVLRALTCRRPKYVYNINRNPLLRLLSFLPKKWQTGIIGKILKPDAKKLPSDDDNK